jgi:hypothetical protein
MERKKFNIDAFPVEAVVKMISDEYGISPDEFNSNFKYGSLPEARQLYCLTLSSYGATNADISRLTGYAPGRVSYTIEAANKLIVSTPFFGQRHSKLLKMLNKLPLSI